MRLRHVIIATTAAFVSLGAFAEGNKAAPDKQAQAQAGASASMQVNSAIIKQAQQKLSAAGHDAGPADGVLGAKTKQALKDFQQAKGIEANGQLDQRTLAALGVSGVGTTPGPGPEASVGASAEQKSSGDSGKAKKY